MLRKSKNAKMLPMVAFALMALYPAYQTIKATEPAVMISTTGKNTEYCQTAAILAFLCSSLMALNLAYSCSSAVKICTTFMPVMCSCKKAFNLETWVRTRLNAALMPSLNR